MNFSNVKPRATKNTRQGGTGGRVRVDYSGWKVLTNQKGTHFELSNSLFEGLGIENKAFASLPPQDGKVFLFLYASDEADGATIYKKTGKGDNKTRKFKADVLRDDLASAGIITLPSGDDVIEANKPHVQYVGMEKVEGAEGLPEGVEAVYEIVAIDSPTASVASEPVPEEESDDEPSPEAPAAVEEEDSF